MADPTLLIQNGSEGQQLSMGFKFPNQGQTTPIGQQLALCDPDGPQDLFCECGDPLWILEGTSTRNDRVARLWKECAVVASYSRPSTDPLFPISGSGPALAGAVRKLVDGGGNFYWAGWDIATAGTTVNARRVDLTGAMISTTVDLLTLLPSTLPSPYTSYTLSPTVANHTIYDIIAQEDGFLVYGSFLWQQSSLSQYRLGLIAFDSSLSPTAAINNTLDNPFAVQTSQIFPMPDGFVANCRISLADNTAHLAADGSVVVTTTTILDPAEVSTHNHYFTMEGGVPYLWIATHPSAAPYTVRRWNLETLVEDTPAWMPGNFIRGFFVYPDGSRFACWYLDSGSSLSRYRVYDSSGTVLIDVAETTGGVGEETWPVRRFDTPRGEWQPTADNRAAYYARASRSVPIIANNGRVFKCPPDSIMFLRQLARNAENQPDRGQTMFIRGQWAHFDYSAWSV